MSTVTEDDIGELRNLIDSRFNELEKGQGEIKAKIQGLEINLATVIAKTEGIEKRVDDINGRLNIMTIGFLSIVGVLVAGILGIIGKIVFFSGNP